MIQKISILLFLVFALSGCASFKDYLGDKFDSLTGVKKEAPAVAEAKDLPTRYSDNPNQFVPTDRAYKKMTRHRMEDESDLGSTAGSLWVMDGQGAYLFAQNKARKEGDLLNVKLDGSALLTVQTKVKVIKTLLQKLEEQRKIDLAKTIADRDAALAAQLEEKPSAFVAALKAADSKLAEVNNKERTPASTTAPVAQSNGFKKPDEKPKEIKKDPVLEAKIEELSKKFGEFDDSDTLADVKEVPTRITERTIDGNFRIRGQQGFIIGKRDYKVIITGLIKPEDFSDAGISASNLIEPQYDIISIRKKNLE